MSALDSILAASRARAERLPSEPVPSVAAGRLRAAIAGRRELSVIAEYKRRSPSAGTIAEDIDLDAQLARYAEAGAAAVSVLTEPTGFGGCIDDVARAAVHEGGLPVLRKDFLVDPRQCVEAAHHGAAAVLLIVACLGARQLAELAGAAHEHGLDVLAECHDGDELDAVLALDDVIVGINNRDLRSFTVDRATTLRLLDDVPADRVVVAESGYATAAQTAPLLGRVDAVLVGTALMRAPDPARLVGAMRAAHCERPAGEGLAGRAGQTRPFGGPLAVGQPGSGSEAAS